MDFCTEEKPWVHTCLGTGVSKGSSPSRLALPSSALGQWQPLQGDSQLWPRKGWSQGCQRLLGLSTALWDIGPGLFHPECALGCLQEQVTAGRTHTHSGKCSFLTPRHSLFPFWPWLGLNTHLQRGFLVMQGKMFMEIKEQHVCYRELLCSEGSSHPTGALPEVPAGCHTTGKPHHQSVPQQGNTVFHLYNHRGNPAPSQTTAHTPQVWSYLFFPDPLSPVHKGLFNNNIINICWFFNSETWKANRQTSKTQSY